MKIILGNDINALISLLDEPNEANYASIRDEILSYGIGIKNKLEIILNNINNEIVRNRLYSIINDIILNDIKYRLSVWYYDEKNKLFDAVLLLSEFDEYKYSKTEFVLKLEEIQKNIWIELNTNLTPLEKIKVFNIIFFQNHQFSVLQKNEFYPHHILLNKVINTNIGTSLSIGLMYVILAQRLEIPVFGYILFNNFYLAYLNKKGFDFISFIKENEPLFYINPNLNGETFDRKVVDYQLAKNNIEHHSDYFSASKNTKILNLYIKSLIKAYMNKGDIYKAEKLANIENYILNKNTKENINSIQSQIKNIKEKY